MSPIEVRKSSIAGLGLFAKALILKGETIVSINHPWLHAPKDVIGQIYPSDSVIWMGFKKTSGYICDKEWKDPKMFPLWYYQNHSDNPNSRMVFFVTKDHLKSVKWVAKKNIQENEEITFHYQPGKKLSWT